MVNHFRKAFAKDLTENHITKMPIVIGIILIYIATVFVQNQHDVYRTSTLWFTIAMFIHVGMYLVSDLFFRRRYWLYFSIQGIIVFDCAIIMPNGYETIYIGLVPLLIFQSMVLYKSGLKVIVTALCFYGIFTGTILWYDGANELVRYIPILAIITLAIRAYSVFYLRQVRLRIQAQKISQELECAYETVEELTLSNERQRVAQDLHDTLSQGLAGLIMQLDAVNANLNRNNVERAKEITENAMNHARKTLADSRLVIDDLRFQANLVYDLQQGIKEEILGFQEISDTMLTVEIQVNKRINRNQYQQIIYIVREGLNNIAKHAEAQKATIQVLERKEFVHLVIVDDGIGFNVKSMENQIGHYGLLGISERVKSLDGKIKISSGRKTGTRIVITIPFQKGVSKSYEKSDDCGC